MSERKKVVGGGSRSIARLQRVELAGLSRTSGAPDASTMIA
jgi:hypothetical protein